jgi:tetratricopeptide (TPR) repeat protein
MDSNHWSGYLDLGLALEQKREFSEAMTALRKAVEVSNNQTWMAFIAHDMALSGDRAGAEKIIADLQQLSKRTYVSPWTIAIIYSGLGDKQRAFMWLEKCYQGREHDLVFSKAWPLFDSLRSDRRYQDLEHRLGLPR